MTTGADLTIDGLEAVVTALRPNCLLITLYVGIAQHTRVAFRFESTLTRSTLPISKYQAFFALGAVVVLTGKAVFLAIVAVALVEVLLFKTLTHLPRPLLTHRFDSIGCCREPTETEH